MLSLEEVVEAIAHECEYQDAKWGSDKQQSLPGYIAIMRKELNEALDGWCDNREGRDSPLSEILQVVSVGIRALMTYGVEGSAFSTNDLPERKINFANTFQPKNTESDTSKVITLTLPNGLPVHIGKATITDMVETKLMGLTTVVTRNGSTAVKETVRQIQVMLQG